MEISTLTGSLSYPEEKIIQYQMRDEKFYLVTLSFEQCSIPAVCSEFLLRDIKGKVTVKGYLASTYRVIEGKRRLFTYFQIVDIVKVPEESKDCDIIKLDVTLTKIGDFKISQINGRAYLPLIGKCYINEKRAAVVHMLATEYNARLLKDAKPDEQIITTGHFHKRGTPIEVVLSSVTRKEESDNVAEV